jgi:apolipoprotein N-acyltransferase
MKAIACVMLSAVACYSSFGLGNAWWLAWLAPVPVLWLAFNEANTLRAFFAAWVAFALGLTNLLRAYANVFPAPVLAIEILGPSLIFALAAMNARRVGRALGPVAALFAFAALWAGYDLLVSFDPGVGSIASPAVAEVAAPLLIQSAALVGFVGITFLLGLVAAGIALSLSTRSPAPVLIAAAFFAANAVYGYLRIATPPAGLTRVALIDSNAYGYWVDSNRPKAGIEQAALQAIDAYAAEIHKLGAAHVSLVVLPENIAPVDSPWRDQASAKILSAVDAIGATVIGGFNSVVDGARRNIAWAFEPGQLSPVAYQKRHLVAGYESRRFAPGHDPRALHDGIEPEICFDMDFPRTIRQDAATIHPKLLAVPASEIGTRGNWANLGSAADDWFHARNAILRSVEDGVPMARSADRGLLTLSDRYGRVVAQKRTSGKFTTLVGELPLGGSGGWTLYDCIGDAFGWLCLALGLGLVGVSLFAGRLPRAEHSARVGA